MSPLLFIAVLDNTRPLMLKTSLDFGFFCDVNQNLKTRGFLANFLGNRSFRNLLSGFKRSWFVICDWWILIRFVCVRCF